MNFAHIEVGLLLKLKDPISLEYNPCYHLALLLVWLLRYLEYLIIRCQDFLEKFGGQLVEDVLIGIFVMLFLHAWIYRAIIHHSRKEWSVYLTLFLEMVLEIALVVYCTTWCTCTIWTKKSSRSLR